MADDGQVTGPGEPTAEERKADRVAAFHRLTMDYPVKLSRLPDALIAQQRSESSSISPENS